MQDFKKMTSAKNLANYFCRASASLARSKKSIPIESIFTYPKPINVKVYQDGILLHCTHTETTIIEANPRVTCDGGEPIETGGGMVEVCEFCGEQV